MCLGCFGTQWPSALGRCSSNSQLKHTLYFWLCLPERGCSYLAKCVRSVTKQTKYKQLLLLSPIKCSLHRMLSQPHQLFFFHWVWILPINSAGLFCLWLMKFSKLSFMALMNLGFCPKQTSMMLSSLSLKSESHTHHTKPGLTSGTQAWTHSYAGCFLKEHVKVKVQGF